MKVLKIVGTYLPPMFKSIKARIQSVWFGLEYSRDKRHQIRYRKQCAPKKLYD